MLHGCIDMQYAYHRFALDAVNFYVAFDDADEGNGALEVAPGLQKQLHGKMIVKCVPSALPCARVCRSLSDCVHLLSMGWH